jgi:hypothetical protein
MSNKIILIIFCSILLLNTSYSQVEEYVLLDSSQAIKAVSQCSRWSPKIGGSWNPSIDCIKTLELHLSAIESLKSDSSRMPPNCEYEHIHNPEKYIRQYVGVIVDDHRYIYINAFPRYIIDEFKKSTFSWRNVPVVICDGGSAFWGVLYDPSSNTFSELSTNGVG